jgi:hypothetical protein
MAIPRAGRKEWRAAAAVGRSAGKQPGKERRWEVLTGGETEAVTGSSCEQRRERWATRTVVTGGVAGKVLGDVGASARHTGGGYGSRLWHGADGGGSTRECDRRGRHLSSGPATVKGGSTDRGPDSSEAELGGGGDLQ